MRSWSKLRHFQSAVLAEWGDFPREFLKKTSELAPSFPCEKGDYCSMNVVHHSEDDIVGVCSSELQFCDKRKLTKEELYIHKIDMRKLCHEINKRLGVSGTVGKWLEFSAIKNLWDLGVCKRGHLYKSIYVLPRDDQLAAAVKYIRHMNIDNYFLVLVPDDKFITDELLEKAEKMRAEILPLDKVIRGRQE